MHHRTSILALAAPCLAGCVSTSPVPVELVRDADYRPWTAPEADRQVVDFRYSPQTWDTSICLPDDPQKALVSEKGELLIDYPGKFTRFRTRIGWLHVGEVDRLVHELEDPRVPIVTSSWGPYQGDGRVSTVAFTVAPDAPLPVAGELPLPVVHAVGPQRAEPGWGKPATGATAAFHDIVVGWDDVIAYRLPTFQGGGVIALGFIESYHRDAGTRVMEVRIEGEHRGTVDPIADFGLNQPGVLLFPSADEDGDGEILVEVLCTEDSPDGNATLAALWAFEERDIDARTLVDGTCSVTPRAFLDCGCGRRYAGVPRADVLRFLDGAHVETEIVVDSEDPLELAEDRRHVLVDGVPFLAFTAAWTNVEHDGGERWIFRFDRKLEEVAVVVASGFGIGDVDVDWVRDREDETRRFWRELDLPYDVIHVPDPRVQRLLETSIRNIWQAREMKEGLPSFQVGPTCYRGLWVVDGAFLLEAVTYLGRGEEARAGIDHLLTFQKEDGSFEILNAYWKENGIVLYILYRHALLTGDLDWLEERWPVVEGIVAAIGNLRERSREDLEAVYAGLLPPGFPDGGVGGVHPEYTNVYWCLAGLRAASEAASLLGRTEQAATWREEFVDLLSLFRERSAPTRLDQGDGTYALPILMEPDPGIDPVRGQWAFCHAVYPGQVFPPEDPLVRGNLRLMDAAECEGLVFGTGWLAQGIWNYFASFYAHAHLWAGHGEKAADVLYAFANHASPLGAWREEQMPQGQGERIVGDMPHNWASAEFVRLVRGLVVLERGDELHLLEGLPRAWVVPGAELRLDGVETDFGTIDLELVVDAAGTSATLSVNPEWRHAPSRIVIHAGAWARDVQLGEASRAGVCTASFSM